MKMPKKIMIEELRESVVVVYTQEEVDQLNKLGVCAIITYINGGICIGSSVNGHIPDTLLSSSEQQMGNVKLRLTGGELKKYLANESY